MYIYGDLSNSFVLFSKDSEMKQNWPERKVCCFQYENSSSFLSVVTKHAEVGS